MAFIRAYGCSTAAGRGVNKFMDALEGEFDVSTNGAFLFPSAGARPVVDRLAEELGAAVREARDQARPSSGRIGVLFASTKGIAQDFIAEPGAATARDPLTPLLETVLDRLEIAAERTLSVSNACSSALAAVRLAEIWLKQGLDEVLILAADAVTPFVQKGFDSLKLLAPARPRPFGREGFWLGEAAAAVLISQHPGNLRIRAALDCDGSIVTRPATSGPSLRRAILKIPEISLRPPDLIFAHATGTAVNEETEAPVLNELFPGVPRRATKPFLGHTLGASAALDLIAACELIRRSGARRILLSSLGFGGAQAAALVESL